MYSDSESMVTQSECAGNEDAAAAEDVRERRARRQRNRRLANRSCGYCSSPAEAMVQWGGRQIPSCGPCHERLRGHWGQVQAHAEALAPEETDSGGWSWPEGAVAGFWCAVNDYPCENCEFSPYIEARLVEPVGTEIVARFEGPAWGLRRGGWLGSVGRLVSGLFRGRP